MKLPKYSLSFLVFIILAKTIYLIFEVYYNGHLIDVISSSNITTNMMHNIEKMGHNISAVGITLLLIPFFYLLVKKIFKEKKNIILLSLFLFSLASFFGFKAFLTQTMDYIVKSNSDKRYPSYYISVLKYGMLNGYMGYRTFIPNSRIKNLTVEDKIMISNIFLLTLIDKSLVDRLVHKGGDVFTDLMIKKYTWDYYEKSERKFIGQSKKIYKLYNAYINYSKKINREFKKIDNNVAFEASYQDFVTELRKKYQIYNREVIKYKNSRVPSNKQVQKAKRLLTKYFRYKKYQKAQVQYRANMINNFGRYISPSRWLPKNHRYPTNASVRRVITEEADRKWEIKSAGLPSNLSEREFYLHLLVKKKVIQNLRKRGLIVSDNFNYSKKMFYTAYEKKIDREFKKSKSKFISKFKKLSNKHFVFGLNYKEFLAYFKGDFTKKYGNKYGTIMYKLIVNHQTNQFYKSFYLPYFKEKKLSTFLLSRKDFSQEKNQTKGDDAIKLLYIPPFAIGISIFAGILNMISLLSIIIFIVVPIKKLSEKWQILIKLTFKFTILFCLIYYPYSLGKRTNVLQPYQVLKVLKSDYGKKYINFLYWLIVVEKYSYNHIYKYIRNTISTI